MFKELFGMTGVVLRIGMLLAMLLMIVRDIDAQVLPGNRRQPGARPTQSQADTAKSDKVHIDHADIRAEVIDGREYLHLTNDVELSQDSIFMYCDTADVIDRQEVRASGNVVIQKGDSLEVFSDTLLYYADTRQADLRGEVALIHGSRQLWTTHLAYDLANNIATYDVPAQLIDSTTQLSSKRGVYWVDTEQALFQDSVVVIDEEFTLLSDSLRYDAVNQKALFIAPTRIYQEGAEIYCEGGYYDLANDRAEFTKNAEYRKGEELATAKRILFHADLNEVRLIGDAYYENGPQIATGDSIIYNDVTGDVRIAGNAEFRDETRYVHSDDVILYNRITEKIGMTGRGALTEGSQTLSADRMDFDQKSGLGKFEGHVIVLDTAAQTVLESDLAEVIRDKGYFKAYGTTRPVLKSLMDADTLYLTADTLISYEVIDTLASGDTLTVDTLRYMRGFTDVRIFRGTMQGLCDSIVFNERDSMFRLFGDPIMWSDTTQFTADTIDLYLRDQALDRMMLRTNALIISSVLDQFFDQISGKQVVAYLDSSALKSMHVVGNAQSVYYVVDDIGAFVGVNQVVSSEIFFIFQKGQLDQIKFNTKPTGSMTPMVQIDHDTLRLEGFEWRDAERPKFLEDLF